jgi:Tfp pilus assembly protein PilN
MFYSTQVAMDITNSDIRVVSFQNDKIKKWMSSPIPAGLIKDGVIQDPQAIGVIIDALFHSLKLRRKGILCTITGLPFIYRTIIMPGTNNKIKVEAIERAARNEMSVAEEDMYLVWQPVAPHQNQIETEYFVVGVPRIALNPFLAALSRGRIKPARMDIKPLALARCAACQDALIISLEKEYFDIVLIYGGLVKVVHSFGNTIKSADIMGLINELVDGMNIAIKSFSRDFPKSTLAADAPILLSGHLASNDAVLQVVQEATGHPVSILNSVLQIPTGLPPELYAATLGLIASQKQGSRQGNAYYDMCVNLLDGIKKRKTRTIQPGYAMAVSAALILLILLFKMYSLRAEAREEVMVLEKSVSTEVQQLSAAQKSNAEAEAMKTTYLEKYKALENELQALRDKSQAIKDLKSDFAASLMFITESLPEGMAFDSIAWQQAHITIEGTAKESLDVLTLTGVLEKNAAFIEARVKEIAPLDDGGVSFQVVIINKP